MFKLFWSITFATWRRKTANITNNDNFNFGYIFLKYIKEKVQNLQRLAGGWRVACNTFFILRRCRKRTSVYSVLSDSTFNCWLYFWAHCFISNETFCFGIHNRNWKLKIHTCTFTCIYFFVSQRELLMQKHKMC